MEITTNEIFNYINIDGFTWYDSGCTYDAKKEIKKVLLTLDADAGVFKIANDLKFELVIIHHSIGNNYYMAYCEIDRRIENLQEFHFCSNQYASKIESIKNSIKKSTFNANKISIVNIAKLYQISCISAHSIIDIYLQKIITDIVKYENQVDKLSIKIKNLFYENNIGYLGENSGITIYSSSNIFKKPYIDLAFAFPPDNDLLEYLNSSECDLIITSHISDDSFIEKFVCNGGSIILINHLNLDILALKYLTKKLINHFPACEFLLLEIY